MFPRFRIVAVSMQRLQVRKARIVSIPIPVVDLDAVLMVEEQPTVTTASTLLFEQPGESRTGTRMPSLSDTPVQPIAVIRTAIALYLHMSSNRYLTMHVEVDGIRSGGWGGEDSPGIEPVPVPLNGPPDRLGGVASVCPAAELDPREVIEPCVDGLAHPNAVVVRPPPDFGVELTDHLALGQCLGAANDPPKLREVRLDIGLGRFDQGLESQAVARGMAP